MHIYARLCIWSAFTLFHVVFRITGRLFYIFCFYFMNSHVLTYNLRLMCGSHDHGIRKHHTYSLYSTIGLIKCINWMKVVIIHNVTGHKKVSIQTSSFVLFTAINNYCTIITTNHSEYLIFFLLIFINNNNFYYLWVLKII